MKKTHVLLLIALLWGVHHLAAQPKTAAEVPDAVKTSFAKQFTKVKKVKWEVEGPDAFEASFKKDGREHAALFDKSGQWLETEVEIKTSEVPAAVIEAVGKHYAGFEIDEAEKITLADGSVYYELEIEKGKEELEILVSQDGTKIRIEEEDDDEGDKKGKDDDR